MLSNFYKIIYYVIDIIFIRFCKFLFFYYNLKFFSYGFYQPNLFMLHVLYFFTMIKDLNIQNIISRIKEQSNRLHYKIMYYDISISYLNCIPFFLFGKIIIII